MLIAGCGDLGTRLGQLLSPATVYGLRRDASRLPDGLCAISANLLTGEGFSSLPTDIDTVVYCATPGARDEASYRAIYVDALARLLSALPQPRVGLRLIYVSSTAVYAQSAGEWVDEQSPAEATAFNGKVLLEGEALAAALVSGSVCLRLSGLYGPGRLWLANRVRAAQALAAGRHYSNRIHVDDAAELAALLVNAENPPPCVIGVDNEPAPMHEVLDWIADRLALPRLARSGNPDDISGKRLRNDLSHTIGWQPRYASYRDGYSGIL